MPNLRVGERMQRCEHEHHSDIRTQKYYIVRRYYNELENHFCQGCLGYLGMLGIVTYSEREGYLPKVTSNETLLNIYGVSVKQQR